MKIAVITTLVAVVLFGSAAYIAVAGTLIIYALGANEAKKEKRVILGLLGVFMFWLAIYTVIQIVRNGGIYFL